MSKHESLQYISNILFQIDHLFLTLDRKIEKYKIVKYNSILNFIGIEIIIEIEDSNHN